MQAKHVHQRALNLLLLDVLDLQDHGAAGSTGHPSSGEYGGIQLLPDPGLGERVFVSLPHAAFSVRLSWLPALAHALVSGVACHPLTPPGCDRMLSACISHGRLPLWAPTFLQIFAG